MDRYSLEVTTTLQALEHQLQRVVRPGSEAIAHRIVQAAESRLLDTFGGAQPSRERGRHLHVVKDRPA